MNNTPTPAVRFTSNMLYCKTEFLASEESIAHALACMEREPESDFLIEVKETPMSAGTSFPCLYRVSHTKPDPEFDAFWYLTGTLSNGIEIYLLQR